MSSQSSTSSRPSVSSYCQAWRQISHASNQNEACTSQDHSSCVRSFNYPDYATSQSQVLPDIVPSGKVFRSVDPRNTSDAAAVELSR